MSKNEIPVDEVSDENVVKNTSTENLDSSLEKEEDPNVETEENEVAKEQETSTEKTSTSSTTEQLEKELSEMKDKYLRIFAEFDNYRKRTQKDKQDWIKMAAKDTLVALLPAIGDFERAIKASNEGDTSEKLPEGIVLVHHKLFKALEQQGLKEMDSTGQDFDAELHEAIAKIPAPTEALKGKVIDTIEKGYYLNDKIIRFAKVVVGE